MQIVFKIISLLFAALAIFSTLDTIATTSQTGVFQAIPASYALINATIAYGYWKKRVWVLTILSLNIVSTLVSALFFSDSVRGYSWVFTILVHILFMYPALVSYSKNKLTGSIWEPFPLIAFAAARLASAMILVTMLN